MFVVYPLVNKLILCVTTVGIGFQRFVGLSKRVIDNSRSIIGYCCGLGVVSLGLVLGGCVWKGGDDAGNRVRFEDSGDIWMVKPVRMRVYPSTQFIQDDTGRSVLEARIELIDDMGDSVKGVGKFRLELLSRSRTTDVGVGQRLYSWNVSATTLEEQIKYYDSITRAYCFHLNLDEDRSAKRDTYLHVMFTTTDGRRLATETSLPVDLQTIGLHGLKGDQ